ncbi:hypothetical protein Q9233_011515 [Columba guinea]|nr:hypothetical protein Q9233_011515 [Columba guinea]
MDPKLLDLTLGVKIPVTPGSKPVFSRGKLGEKVKAEERGLEMPACVREELGGAFVSAAPSCPVHTLERLSQLHRPSCSFDLGDPYSRRMSNEYNSLHDPHLQAYHQRTDNLERLKRQGLVTSDGNVGLDAMGLIKTVPPSGVPERRGGCAEEQLPSRRARLFREGGLRSQLHSAWGISAPGSPQVVCSLKEFNQYRQYRTMLKLEAKQAFIREQEKLQEHLPKLEHAPKLPGAINTSRPGPRVLQPQTPSCPGLRVLQPQTPSCPGPRVLQPQTPSCPGPRVLQPQTPSCPGLRVLQPQKPSGPPPPKGGNNAMKWGRRLRVNDALGKGQTHAQSEPEHKGAAGALTAAEPPEIALLRCRQQIEQVAKGLMATVLERWEKHTASGSSEAPEPGPAAEETTQADKSEEEKSGQAEPAACDRAPSGASLEHLARIVIDCVCCTLEAFVTCQCEQGDLCKYSGILELLREELYKNSGSRPRSPAEGQPWMKAKDSQGHLKSRAWSPGKERGRPHNEMEGRAVPPRMPSPAPAHGFAGRGKPVGGEPQQPRQQRGR